MWTGRLMPNYKRPGGSLPDYREKCEHPKKGDRENLCKRRAGEGTQHPGVGYCKWHGGTSSSHMIRAEIAQIKHRLEAFGTPLDVDPATALLTEVKRAAGIVEWLASVIGSFTSGIDLSEGPEQARAAVLEVDKDGWRINLWIDFFFRERKHLAAVAKAALDAGVAERQVRLQEEQGRLIAFAIRQILDGLELSPDQRRIAPDLVARHLRAIEAG